MVTELTWIPQMKKRFPGLPANAGVPIITQPSPPPADAEAGVFHLLHQIK